MVPHCARDGSETDWRHVRRAVPATGCGRLQGLRQGQRRLTASASGGDPGCGRRSSSLHQTAVPAAGSQTVNRGLALAKPHQRSDLAAAAEFQPFYFVSSRTEPLKVVRLMRGPPDPVENDSSWPGV